MVTVSEAVVAELIALRMESSSLGASIAVLAAQLDDPKTSATSKSMCAKALKDLLAEVRELAGQETGGDRLDELAKRRSKRVSAA